MELLIEAFAVIAIFSAVHERVLEALRSLIGHFTKEKGTQDVLTVGGWSWVPAVALALATQANLFALFSNEGGKNGVEAFFDRYMNGFGQLSSAGELTSVELRRLLAGCVLMGLTTTLGSRFWHDLVKALIDLRTGLKVLPETARRLAAPEVSQALGTAVNELARHGDDANQRVATALRTAARATTWERPAHEVVTADLVSKALVQTADLLSPPEAPGTQEPIASALRRAAVTLQGGT